MTPPERPTLCMIARNEEADIAAVLAHAKPHCGKMIVLDTGSDDRTRELAEAAGAEVRSFAWNDDFAAARNRAVSLAPPGWVLMLDADERLDEAGWEMVLDAVVRPDAECFDLRQVNYSRNTALAGFRENDLKAPGFDHYPGYTVSWLTRLFRNDRGYAFVGCVHEHLARDGKIKDGIRLEADIHHHGLAIVGERMRAKSLFYLKLGEKKSALAPGDFKALFELGVARWETGDMSGAERNFAAAARLDPREVKNLIALFTVRQLMGGLDSAEAGFREIVRLRPDDPRAHAALGACLMTRGKFPEAVAEFRSLVARDPDFPRGRRWLAEAYAAARKAEPGRKPTLSVCYIAKNEARWIAESLSNVRPHADEIIVMDTGSTDDTPRVASEHGAKVFSIPWRDDFSRARNESLKRATSEWILVLDADEALSDADWEGVKNLLALPAAEMFFLVQTTYTETPTVMGFKANELNCPEAQGHAGYFESPLVRLFRNTPDVAFHGVVHEHAHHADKDVRPLMTRIRIHHYGKCRPPDRMTEKSELYRRLGERKILDMPDDPQAHCEMALQLMELGFNDEVEPYFLKSLELKPDFDRALIAFASFLMSEKRDKEALDVFMRLIAAKPNDPQAYVFTASLLVTLGRYDVALRMMRTARELGAGVSGPIAMNEGVIHMQLKDFARAEASFAEALSLNPSFAPALLNMGILRLRQRRYAEAEEFSRRAVSSDPKASEGWQRLGEALFSQGRRIESLECFLKAHELGPSDPEVTAQAALNAKALGRTELAREFEERLMSLPADPRREAALQLLERFEGGARASP